MSVLPASIVYERVIEVDLTALSRVKHNGKWYIPGDEIKKVKKEDGDRLIYIGAAVELKVAKDGKKEE